MLKFNIKYLTMIIRSQFHYIDVVSTYGHLLIDNYERIKCIMLFIQQPGGKNRSGYLITSLK
jgi:hypothetical protein